MQRSSVAPPGLWNSPFSPKRGWHFHCWQVHNYVLVYLCCSCRCFALIDSSTLEQTRDEMETDTQTHLESLVELGLSSTVSTILTQCSTEIYKVTHTCRTHTHTHSGLKWAELSWIEMMSLHSAPMKILQHVKRNVTTSSARQQKKHERVRMQLEFTI